MRTIASNETNAPPVSGDGAASVLEISQTADILAFRAPYLEKKLLRLGVVQKEEEAAHLLQEVKKYLVLCELHPNHRIPMFSARVDEAWHQFVLFTDSYATFCKEFVGRFVHHVPAEAPEPAGAPRAVMTLTEFRSAYELTFGEFSSVWSDELAITPRTRLTCSSWAMPLAVRSEGKSAVLFRSGEAETVLCRVNLRAQQALAFVQEHRWFMVRELPGLASDDERVDLCRPLVRFNILRLAL